MTKDKHHNNKKHPASSPSAVVDPKQPDPPGAAGNDKNENSEGSETQRFQRSYLRTQWLLVAIACVYSFASGLQWYESRLAVEAMEEANRNAKAESVNSAAREAAANRRATISDKAARDSASESSRKADASLEESRRLNRLTADLVSQARRQAEASNQLTREGLAEARKQHEIAERNLAIAQQAEAPAFSVAAVSVTTEGLLLKITITIKNSGKGVAKIRQVRWTMASETGAWSTRGNDSAPDSTLLGPGDIRNLYQSANWPNADALKADAIAGIRFYAAVDYVDFAGKKMTAAVCQHYDSAGGARDCLNAGPD